MNERSTRNSTATLALVRTILIVDPDPIFRMGLRLTLEKLTQLQVLEASSATASLTMVQQFSRDWSSHSGMADLGLVVMEPGLQASDPPQAPYLWQQFKQQHPKLPILLLGAALDPSLFALARRLGVEGYSPKGVASEAMAALVLRLASGERSWPADIQHLAMNAPLPDPMPTPIPTARVNPTPPPAQPLELPLLQRWRYNILAKGLDEIAADTALLQMQLQRSDLSWLNRQMIQGRLREMRCAHWCVKQALPAEVSKPAFDLPQPPPAPTRPIYQPQPVSSASALVPPPAPSLTTNVARPGLAHLPTLLLETIQTKTDISVMNRSEQALEIDILRPDRRRELVLIVLGQFKTLLQELQAAGVNASQLRQRRGQLLRDLWQESLTEFYGRYTLAPVAGDTAADSATVGLVPSLLQEQATVQASLLDPIPLVSELLEHLLLAMPLRIDNSNHAPGTIAAMRQAEALLSHLVLQVANAVVQPLLNQYANQEWIKQDYYDQQVMSTREIERFRNRLSWQYRLDNLWTEPQEIFESRVTLLTLGERGIDAQSIYMPRQGELEQLGGTRYFVTLALEFRDAVAPPLRAVVTFVGQGLIYLLTQVVGRGLGLIGRGILQGIGSSWQEVQTSRRHPPAR
jgi:DNA-binding NarL/FixJ family response regulator